MTAMNIRAALVADPELGAANVVTRLLAHGADPAGPGLTFDVPVDDHPAFEPLNLGELDRRVNARAAWLHAHGIGPRDPVAVWSGRCADHILSFLALARLGAIAALINGNLGPDIAAEYIRRLRAVAVLADAPHHDLLRRHELGIPAERLIDVAELGAGDPDAAPAPYRHDKSDPIVITHSSGTTGLPKAIVHSHSTLFAATRALRLNRPLPSSTKRILSALPAPHTAGILSVNQALCGRSELLFLSSQQGAYVLEQIERWHPTAVFGFAVTWVGLSQYDLSTRDMDSVAVWFNTGDSAHEVHIRPLVNVGSHQEVGRAGVTTVKGSGFVDGLGSTEMGHSMFHITHRPDTERYGRCIGKPHSFVDIAVLNLDGTATPVGEVGHLGIRSPTLALGYWNDSVTTYRSRLCGYYLTGDLVYRDEENYFYHVDRAVDSVQLPDGSWLHTAMSEERVLAACPDVRDCAVSAVAQDGRVHTDVLLQLGIGADPTIDRRPLVAAALGPAIAGTLRRVEAVGDDEIPLGATGKIRKLVMRERQLTAGADA